jgi:hypothetical protein
MLVWNRVHSFAAGVVVGCCIAAAGGAVYSKSTKVTRWPDFAPQKTASAMGFGDEDGEQSHQSLKQDAVTPMTDRDKAHMAFQGTCPICGGAFGAKNTTPGRVQLTVFVCGRECLAEFDKAPRAMINKWTEICDTRAKLLERR